MYRSNRLDRIAKSLRQPNLSQSTLCSASGASSSNGGLTQHQQPQPRSASIDNGTISAFDTTSRSPAHSPNCPPGAIDIEVEVGDHEVDSMFRDPGPRPLILARATPPLQVRFLDRWFHAAEINLRFDDVYFPFKLLLEGSGIREMYCYSRVSRAYRPTPAAVASAENIWSSSYAKSLVGVCNSPENCIFREILNLDLQL